jgi:hypothetical protein
MVAYVRGDYDRAAAHFSESHSQYRALGDIAAVMDAAGDAGFANTLRGNIAAAQDYFAESLDLAAQLNARVRVGWAFMGLGHVAAVKGRATQAVQLLAASAAVRDPIGEVMRPSVQAIYDRTLAEQRQQLGEEAFATAWERGYHLSLEQALSEGHAVIAVVRSDG